jgi:hypothetical protein
LFYLRGQTGTDEQGPSRNCLLVFQPAFLQFIGDSFFRPKGGRIIHYKIDYLIEVSSSMMKNFENSMAEEALKKNGTDCSVPFYYNLKSHYPALPQDYWYPK